MSFDYEKIRGSESDHSWWTSYADLWSVLSVVFLLMYVTASLRTGAEGVQAQLELQQMAQKKDELQEQLRVYSNLREEAVQQQGAQEQEVYKKLMGKLSLLQEEAKNEKDDLRAKARENEEKEFALNQYQQIVRNIIDSNVLSKAQINRRDKTIVAKKQTIAEKQAEIKGLNQDVQEREKIIAKNENQIETINTKLNIQVERLNDEQKRAKLSRAAAEAAIARLRNDSQKKIAAIKEETDQVRSQMQEKLEQTRDQYVSQLDNLKAENEAKLAAEKAAFQANLAKTRLSAAAKAKKLEEFKAQAEARSEQLAGELEGLEGKVKATEQQLGQAQGAHQRAMASLQAAESAKARLAAEAAALAAEKEGLSGQVAKTRQELEGARAEGESLSRSLAGTKGALSAAQAEKNRLAGEAAALAAEKEGLSGQVAKTRQELAGARAEGEALSRSLASTKGSLTAAQAEKTALGGELAAAKELLNAKKKLIDQIKQNFAKAGVPAGIDAKSGDVTIDFGEEYFESGSAQLKPGIVKTLLKFIPNYSKSLFQDPKTADKIASIEIIGYASSTYKGRYVNPSSLKPGNQEAINYNLKLSFDRANSIFKYIFDPDKMKYEHQKRLLPMVKVVGRGFLPDGVTPKDLPEDMSEKQFCAQYNCKKAQKVIVKFNLKD